LATLTKPWGNTHTQSHQLQLEIWQAGIKKNNDEGCDDNLNAPDQ